MRYLFFDIECANNVISNSKICSFGYVLTDSNYNIIKQEDIIINPNSEFHFDIKKTGKEIKLKYDYQYFYKHPTFDHFYEKIKRLLTDKNNMVFGHSVNNDVNYIIEELIAYNLESLDFTYYDTQQMYRYYKKIDELKSLDTVALELSAGHQNEAHDSLSDAILTKDIAIKLASLNNLKLDSYAKSLKYISGSVKDFNIKSNYNYLTINKEEITRFGYYRFLDSEIKSFESFPKLELKDKVFAMSFVFENENYTKMVHIIQRIIDLGGSYTTKSLDANYYCIFSKKDIDGNIIPCLRYEAIKKNKKKKDIKVITLEELLNMLHLDINKISKIDNKLAKHINSLTYNRELTQKQLLKDKNNNLSKSSLGSLFKDFFKDI